MTNNHFNSHNNSSITETSRATINLEPQVAAAIDRKENSFPLSLHQETNGQKKNSSSCSNGGVEKLNKVESTDAWLQRAQQSTRKDTDRALYLCT